MAGGGVYSSYPLLKLYGIIDMGDFEVEVGSSLA